MKHVEDRFQGAAATTIFWRAWLPDGDPKAVVVIAHGAGEHSARYAHVAARLVGAGYAVYALDHRGHGRSDGKRMRFDRIEDVVSDLRQFVSIARRAQPGRALFLVGHSVGGTLALAYAVDHQDEIEGLALSAPLTDPDTLNPLERLAANVLSVVAPGAGIAGVDPEQLSHDPELVRAYREDPLVFHDKLPARTVAELAKPVRRFPETVRRLRVPLLVLIGSDDQVVRPSGGKMVNERAGSTDKSIRVYDGFYHEIFNEVEKERVLDDLVAWLDARLQAERSVEERARTSS
jgi:lysophospholipase